VSIDGGARRAHQIGEVGEIRFATAMTEGMADVNGRFPVVGGVVIAARDADPAAVIKQVRARLDQQRPALPKGVDLVVVYDRSELSRRVTGTLLRALGEEIAVVVLVVFIFLLHGRSAVVPLGTLLLVLALTFVAMRVAGLPATVMSLGGIAIALGMAVDAELVAIEACHRWVERETTPGSRRGVLLAAADSFTPAILTSLLIAGLSFVPALAFTGETGRLLRPLVLTKTLVIAAALAVTLLVAPALRQLLLRGPLRPELGNPLTALLIRLYRPVVDFALARPWFTLGTAALAAVSCLPLVGQLGSEFLPHIDEGELLYMPSTSADVPPPLGEVELRRQDALLMRRPEVAMVFGKLGRADSATDPAPCSMAETVVRLKPRSAWPLRPRRRWHSDLPSGPAAPLLRWLWPEAGRLTTAELVAELDGQLRSPGWSNAWTAPVRARMDMMATGVRTAVGIRIVAAPDADQAAGAQAGDRTGDLARAVRNVIARLPGTRSASVESPGGETVLRFVPDAAALERHQVDPAVARASADLLLGGGRSGQLLREQRAVPVRLLPDRQPRPLDELLRAATVRTRPTAGAAPIALALVGRPTLSTAPAMLRTEGGRAVAHVYVDVDAGIDLGGYVERAQQALSAATGRGEISLRPGEALAWTGQYQLMEAGRRRLLIVAPIVLLLMLGLLWLQFRSWIAALIVLGSVPLALVGSVWTLFLLGYPLSAPVWVGLISVVGLAMQTGVVMVVYIDEAFYQRVRAGTLQTRADIIAAHAEGTVRRLRPKLMTVITMAAALLPLLWSRGAGAEIMRRIAAPMVGGLVFSAFVTLEVIPVLYTLWRQRQLDRAQRRGVPIEQIIGTMPRWARRG
jgi:copper/silver efflux system protein